MKDLLYATFWAAFVTLAIVILCAAFVAIFKWFGFSGLAIASLFFGLWVVAYAVVRP